MAGKRKRNKHGIEGDQKRQRICVNTKGKDSVVKQAVLAQYYPQVFTLREYLLFKLPATSKVRRKKILNLGGKQSHGDRKECGVVSAFLDRTLVGVMKSNEVLLEERIQQWTSFSQKVDMSDPTFANLSGTGNFSQSEVSVYSSSPGGMHDIAAPRHWLTAAQIVDFAIWTTFSKISSPNSRAKHLLCQGFRKDVSARSVHRGEIATSAIPGVISTYPNHHVAAMKASPWPEVLALMGKEGERMMIDLILDCGIFLAIESGRGSYHQLSGQSICLKSEAVLMNVCRRASGRPSTSRRN